MPDHDDRHDRGLLFDLATLRDRGPAPSRLARRSALKLMGAGAVGLVLAACGDDSSSSSAGSTTTTGAASGSSTTAAPITGATTTGSGTVTEAIPSETGGPFPGDGSNGPNVLNESGVVRSDIRSSFGSYSGTAAGVPLGIDLTIVEAGTGRAIDGAAVYLWHCDQAGRYSLYSSGATDQNYLRGVQGAGGDGKVSFTSIFPAAYSGRWPHIHFEVFSSLAGATNANHKLVTSQLALPEGICNQVYASDGYGQSVSNMARSSLSSDNVFRDGWDLQLPSVSGSVGSNLRVALTVAV